MIHVPDRFSLKDYAGAIGIESVIFALHKIKPITIGSFILTTKENHQNLGGFKEGSMIGEDLDYARRSVANGASHKIHVFPHVRSATRRESKEGWWPTYWKATRVLVHDIRKGEPFYPGDRIKHRYGHFGKK